MNNYTELENGKFKCNICGKEYTKKGIGTHIWRNHTEEGKKFIPPNKNKTSWRKGLTKDTDERIKKESENRKQRYETGEISGSFKNRTHTEKSKEKIRQGRFNYLSKKLGQTGWEKAQRREMTFLEELFYNECILKYNLLEKYDISYNYPVYPYFLDFAFVNINFVIETDGACHFNNGQERMEHDIKRDKYLTEKGWKIFRISYDENMYDKIQELLIILGDVENYQSKSLEERLYKGKIVKKVQRTREKYFEDYKNKYTLIYQERVEKILNSTIDFSKLGWVNRVAKLINMNPQSINRWMKKHMLDFYNERCFKRKTNK